MRVLGLLFACFFAFPKPSMAFFGSEMVPLFQMVSGQLTEIERLAENISAIKEQTTAIKELNDRVNETIDQLEHLEMIVNRAQGLDPTAVQSLSDLNDLMSRAKSTREEIEEMMETKVTLADQAIESGAMQSDTAYKTGQEMVATGTKYSSESKGASPGRASQISAASSSAQMVATGVQLQTMAQMVQLQAISLDLQKSQMDRDLKESRLRNSLFKKQLEQSSKERRGDQ